MKHVRSQDCLNRRIFSAKVKNCADKTKQLLKAISRINQGLEHCCESVKTTEANAACNQPLLHTFFAMPELAIPEFSHCAVTSCVTILMTATLIDLGGTHS